MNTEIKVKPIDYNELHTEWAFTTVLDTGEVILNGPDHALLFLISADDDMDLIFQPGDTVFAGGEKRYSLSESDRHVLYLECGPYVYRHSDGTDRIKFMLENGSCSMEVYQLN